MTLVDVVHDRAPLDRGDLARLEAVIERGVRAFYDVGCALYEIRQHGLDVLRERGYSSFRDYIERRWHFSERAAYHFINAALVVDNLTTEQLFSRQNGGLPVNESQARELSRLVPELQPVAYERARQLSHGGRVTSSLVRQARKLIEAETNGDGEPAYVGPYLNFWSTNECDPRFGLADYDGRMPGQFVQALLWLYTVENDLVVDPFAGSGTTLDVCRAMGRRCAAFDLAPSRDDIVQADACSLVPEQLESPASFVLLDPPYWSQKQGDYTSDPRDFSNLPSVFDFYAQVEHLARVVARLLDGENAHVALCVSQSRVGGVVYDLAFESAKRFERAGYTLVERIVTNYGQAASIAGHWIARARSERFLLRGYRDILVFRS